MSDNNLHKIFADTTCISTEIMMDYLTGKLSEKEKNKVEVHISSCKMCRDEFEGLSLLSDKSKLPLIVTTLNEKIDKRISVGGKKISLFKTIYKIAAAIVLLIGSTWLINLYVNSGTESFDESAVSQAMEEKAEVEKDTVLVEPITEMQNKIEEQEKETKNKDGVTTKKDNEFRLETSKEEIVALDDVTEEAKTEELYMEEEIAIEDYAASTTEKITIPEDKVKETTNLLDEKRIVQKEEQKIEQFDDDAVIEGENDEVIADYALAENKKLDNKDKRGQLRRNKLFKGKQYKKRSESMLNTVVIDNFDLAMTEYKKRDYQQAIKLFKKSLSAHANPDEVHFYLAKSYTNLDDTENALLNYNKIIAMVESPYYEDALWNKAQLLMELNKRKSAVNSLNQLKTRKGNYSKKAGRIIDSLNIVTPEKGDK